MSQRHLTALLIAAATSLAVTPAFSQHLPPGNPPPAHHFDLPPADPLPPLLHGIVLSDEQQDRLFELQQNARVTQRGRMKDLMKARGELRQLALSSDFDEARAKKLAETIASAQAELELQHARMDQMALRILSADQRRELASRRSLPAGRDCPPPPR